jgi:nitroreductase
MAINRTRGLARRHLLQAAVTLTLGPMLLPRATGAGTPAPPTAPKSFADVVRQRAMIRAYKSDPVSEEKIQQLLQYAVRAPSGGNLQPWEFVVVKNPEVRAKLAKAAMDQTSVATAPHYSYLCRYSACRKSSWYAWIVHQPRRYCVCFLVDFTRRSRAGTRRVFRRVV